MEHTTETAATLAREHADRHRHHVDVGSLAPGGAPHRSGVVWSFAPAMEVLPLALPGIRPREVAVLTSLVRTCAGLGYALGPIVTGFVAEQTSSLSTGCLTVCLCTSVGIMAGLRYPHPWQPPATVAAGCHGALPEEVCNERPDAGIGKALQRG